MTEGPVMISHSLVQFAVIFQSYGPDLQALLLSLDSLGCLHIES